MDPTASKDIFTRTVKGIPRVSLAYTDVTSGPWRMFGGGQGVGSVGSRSAQLHLPPVDPGARHI